MDPAALARLIDHTLLRPEATDDEVAELCREANRLEVGAVCVSPARLPLPEGLLGRGVAVAVVCGFPSGAHRPEVKATEAATAVAHGATEVDVVVDLGAIRAGDWTAVTAGLNLVRASVPAPNRLKVILETAVLTDEQIVRACRVAEEAGADYVKTSTGFPPAGGATVEAVRLLADTVGGRLGVKASGGIRTREAAQAMVDAGATRLGTSATAAILGAV
jgi:deoxyribose-phosphate aldolase